MRMSFKDRIAALKTTRSYCQEQAKLEFVAGVSRLMHSKNISNSNLAERMETSAAYVTKILRGDVNYTIETMVKVTHALGGRFHIHVADAETNVRWLESIPCMQTHPAMSNRKSKSPVDVARFLESLKNEADAVYA